MTLVLKSIIPMINETHNSLRINWSFVSSTSQICIYDTNRPLTAMLKVMQGQPYLNWAEYIGLILQNAVQE